VIGYDTTRQPSRHLGDAGLTGTSEVRIAVPSAEALGLFSLHVDEQFNAAYHDQDGWQNPQEDSAAGWNVELAKNQPSGQYQAAAETDGDGTAQA
jgi:hypothetical protein